MKYSSGRSEKRFSRDLEKAVVEHGRKLEEGKLSLDSRAGKLVIVVSGNTDHRSKFSHEEQRKAFNNEADEIAARRDGLHGGVEIKRKATDMELGFDFADKEVSDMVLIGHGNIGDFWLENGEHFGWGRAAKYARYLKRGTIEQRVCGNFPLKTSVPLGTFALADQTRLIAPLGHAIDDVYPDEGLFKPVFSNRVNTKEDIASLIAAHYVDTQGS